MFIEDSVFDKFLNKIHPNMSPGDISKISITSAIFISLFLVIIKLIACYFTKSITIQASALDSIVDTIASSMSCFALALSQKQADEEHGFGHGKVEGITALLQSIFVLFVCYHIFTDAINSFKHNHAIENSFIGIFVMVISSVLVYVLVSFQRYSIKKSNSMVVTGDSLHYAADLLMNVGVLISLFLSSYIPFLDACVGVLVCCYILFNTVQLLRRSLHDLMDTELPKQDKLEIIKKIHEHKEVLDILHMKTRTSGIKKIVHVDIVLSRVTPFVEADKTAKDVEKNIAKLFDSSEIMVTPVPHEKL